MLVSAYCRSLFALHMAQFQYHLPRESTNSVRESSLCSFLVFALCGFTVSQSLGQTPATDDSLPEVSIFRSGNYIITEGEDAVFVLTAEPAPTADLTVNLEISPYDGPSPFPIDEQFLTTGTLQAIIDVSGETFFVAPTEDDDGNEPLAEITFSIAPGDGYEIKQACTRDLRCNFPLNVYADELIWTDPESAWLYVRDNDGPQAMNGDIASETTALLDQLGTVAPAAADVRELEVLVENSKAVADDMAEGGTTQNETLLLLNSLRMQIEISERIAEAGIAVAKEVVNSIVRNATSVIQLHELYPPPERLLASYIGPSAELEFEIREFLASSKRLIPLWAPLLEEHDLIETFESLTGAVGDLVGAAYRNFPTESVVEDFADISGFALEALLAPVAKDLGIPVSSSDDASIEKLLKSNPRLLHRLIHTSGIDLDSSVSLNSDVNSGNPPFLYGNTISPVIVRPLRQVPSHFSIPQAQVHGLSRFVQTDNVGIRSTDSFVSVATIIGEALGDEVAVGFDHARAYTEISVGGKIYPVLAPNISLVSPAVPEGIFSLDDGSVMIVDRRFAIQLVPASIDIFSLAGHADSLGYSLRLMENGGIVLTGNGASFAATFSYNSAPLQLFSERTVSNPFSCPHFSCIAAPSKTNPASPDHYFTVGNFSDNGNRYLEQRLLPFFAHGKFWEMAAALGLNVATDRFDTGIVTIEGFGRFRPDYKFEGDLSVEPLGNAQAPAFEETDANGDGVMDYRITIGNFTQVLYGVP